MNKMSHYYDQDFMGENWFSCADFYADIVSKLPDGAVVVEVGCWRGKSTACLGVEIFNSGKNISLICVDAWRYIPSTEQPVSSQADFDQVYKEFLQNTKPFESFLSVIRADSTEAARLFEDKSIDFCFIDANHTYDSVKSDSSAWLPKIKQGGIIAGHDYFTRVHPGVKKAVDELFPNAILIPEQNVWQVRIDEQNICDRPT